MLAPFYRRGDRGSEEFHAIASRGADPQAVCLAPKLTLISISQEHPWAQGPGLLVVKILALSLAANTAQSVR